MGDDTILILVLVILLGLLAYLVFKPKPQERTRQRIVKRIQEKIPEPIPTQLLLLLDTTSSMGEEIERCKNTLTALVGMINGMAKSPDGSKFINLEVGFVSYKDKRKGGGCDAGHLDGVPFTSDVSEVQKAIAACTPSGGGDLPEDMRGGFEKALEYGFNSDPKAMKVICVITDDPCHGSDFNGGQSDTFPDDNDDMKSCLQQLVDNRVSILLSSITDHTKAMSERFALFYKENKPAKEKGQFGIAFKQFDLNRALDGDKEFVDKIFGAFKDMFDGTIPDEMKEKMKQMMMAMKAKGKGKGADKKKD